MGGAKDTLYHLLFRHSVFQVAIVVLAVSAFIDWRFPQFLDYADHCIVKIEKFVHSLSTESLFWVVVIIVIAYIIIGLSMVAWVLAVALAFVARYLWEQAVVLLPVSIGAEYLWEEWYRGSSVARRARWKRRTAERAFFQAYPTEKGKKPNIFLRFGFALLASIPLYFVSELVVRIPHGLTGIAFALVVPTIMLWSRSTIATTYHRHIQPKLVANGLIATPVRPAPLPTEIWEIILAYALDVPEYFETICEAENLPNFLAYHRMRSRSLPSWDPLHQSVLVRRQLRLVSKAWRSIVGKHAPLWYTGTLNVDSMSNSSFEVYRRVDLYDKHNIEFINYKQLNLPLMEPKLSPMTVLAIQESTYPMVSTQNQMFALFQSTPHVWGGIESLAFHSPAALPNCVSRISSTFQLLGSLILDSTRIIEANVILPNLHTLKLEFDSCTLQGWWLPKLRHLSLTNRRSSNEYRANLTMDSVVPLHWDKLEGLMLNRETVILDSVFWARFPLLRLLGCVNVDVADGPPVEHPIRHLYISSVYIYSTAPERFESLL
ncbi:hypothetical protein FRC17_005960, partial [Serendipita sp. 399]